MFRSIIRPRNFFWPAALFCLTLFSPSLQSGTEEEGARIPFFHGLKAKEEGNLLKAEQLFRRAVEEEPENRDFHFELGNLLLEKGELAAARLEYEEALMISPDFLAARYNLGLVYRELGLTAEARQEFRKVLELDPANVKAQLQIGYVYQAEGFFEEAEEAFRKAREMDYSSAESQRALEDLQVVQTEAQRRSQAKAERSLLENQTLLEYLVRRREREKV